MLVMAVESPMACTNRCMTRHPVDFSALTDTLLAALETLGPIVLAITVLVGTFGLPVPSTALLLAAGAMAREGLIDLPVVLVAGLIAAVAGDGAGYLLGHTAGERAAGRFSNGLWQQAQDRFTRQGWAAIYLSRWLLTPIAVPVNVVAGMAGYSAHRFLAAEVAGDLTWIALYAGIGVVAGAQWQRASELLGQYSGYAMGLALALVAGWWMLRTWTGRTRSVQVEQV